MIAWAGSVIAMLVSTGFGFASLEGTELVLLVSAAIIYIVGVQVPTAAINIPLNNALQEVDTATASVTQLAAARERFESRWNRWNGIRTAMATLTTALLLVVLLQV